jgi:hypothetical protein
MDLLGVGNGIFYLMEIGVIAIAALPWLVFFIVLLVQPNAIIRRAIGPLVSTLVTLAAVCFMNSRAALQITDGGVFLIIVGIGPFSAVLAFAWVIACNQRPTSDYVSVRKSAPRNSTATFKRHKKKRE